MKRPPMPARVDYYVPPPKGARACAIGWTWHCYECGRTGKAYSWSSLMERRAAHEEKFRHTTGVNQIQGWELPDGTEIPARTKVIDRAAMRDWARFVEDRG